MPRADADLNEPIAPHIKRDFPRLRLDESIGTALERLRREPPPERVIYFYVVDAEGRLRGVVPTRRLLLSAPETPVADVMLRRVIAIPESATVLEACEFFVTHRLLAFPVIAADGRMLGVVDVQMYTEEILDLQAAERTDDLFQLIGVHLTAAQRRSPILSFRRRFPWLLCNIAGGILAGFLAGAFEAELQKAVALALFMPVVLSLAESVGIQSVSLALQSLHGGRPRWRDLGRQLTTELRTGALLGTACAMLVGAIALIWIGEWSVAASVFVGIAGGVTAAAAVGLAMPVVLHLLRLDPQVAAGPIALALADFIALLAFFLTARSAIGG